MQDNHTPDIAFQPELDPDPEIEALLAELDQLEKRELELLSLQAFEKDAYEKRQPPSSCVVGLENLDNHQIELLLRDSASQMHYLIADSVITVPAYRVGADGRVLDANLSFYHWLGYKPEQVLGGALQLADFTPSEDIAKEKAHFADFNDSIVSNSFEGSRISADGSYIPAATTLRLISLAPLEYVGFMLDLTGVRTLEENLRRRNSIFSAIVEEMPHIVFLCDENGATRQFNRRLYELTGKTAAQDDGTIFLDSMHEGDKQIFLRRFKQAVKEERELSEEFRLLAQDGECYWHTIKLQPLSCINGLLALTINNNMDGEKLAHFADSAKLWIGTATDIDRRKRIMDEVLESAQAFQSLANQIPQIVWTAAPDGRIEFLNERWYEFSGHSREHKMGLDFALFIHPDDRREYMSRWKNSVRSGDAFEADFRLREALESKEDYVRCLARAVALRNYRGEIAQWIGTWTSI
jgi:PAS domain S-box-containing protein